MRRSSAPLRYVIELETHTHTRKEKKLKCRKKTLKTRKPTQKSFKNLKNPKNTHRLRNEVHISLSTPTDLSFLILPFNSYTHYVLLVHQLISSRSSTPASKAPRKIDALGSAPTPPPHYTYSASFNASKGTYFAWLSEESSPFSMQSFNTRHTRSRQGPTCQPF